MQNTSWLYCFAVFGIRRCKSVYLVSPEKGNFPTRLCWREATRCKAKPGNSPPAYPLATCFFLSISQFIGSPASIESSYLFAWPCTSIAHLVVCRRRRPSECHANYKASIAGRFCPQNWLPRQRPRYLCNNKPHFVRHTVMRTANWEQNKHRQLNGSLKTRNLHEKFKASSDRVPD